MRVVVLNRRKIGVTVIIIGLMLVLFGLEKKFDGRLKYVALMQNNINSLKEYQGLDKKFSYKLPSEWQTKEEKLGGNEIIYHNNFTSEDAIIHGIIEVWDMNVDLKNFLEKSKEISEKYNSFKDYNITPIKINKDDGYLVSYTMETSPGVYYKSYEYFIKEDSKFFRFSFFVREPNFKETMPTIFKTIVETFKYRQ